MTPSARTDGPVLLPARSVTTLDTVHCCDALALLRTLGDASIDMILTSPPYDELRQYNGYSFCFEDIARAAYRVLKPGGVMVWVVGDSTIKGSETLTSFRQALYFTDTVGFNMHDTMIWEKQGTHPNIFSRYANRFEYMFVLSKGKPNTFNPIKKPNKLAGQKTSGGQRQRNGEVAMYQRKHVEMIVQSESILGNVWDIPSGWMLSTTDRCAYTHPAQFPEELARRHIATWSNPGDTVLDFFMGSGTTAKVARNLSRHYIGCDISAEYVALAQRRLADTDPYQATTLSTGDKQLSLFEWLAS